VQGILLRSLPDAACSKYVGIDLSASAIAAAQEQRRELQRPELQRPEQLVERHAQSLRGGGVMLVSMCTAARGSAAIRGQLKAHYATVAETLVRDGETRVSWACAVLRPLV
jgi:hypothetical protein